MSRALEKMRKICSALPGTVEGAHHGSIAFKAGKKLYATFRERGDDAEIVFGLEPAHAEALLEHEPERYTAYKNAKHAVVVLASKADWKQLAAYLKESHRLVWKS